MKNAVQPTIPHPHELRIGNFVYDEDRNIVRVESICSERIDEYVKVSQKVGGVYSSNIYKIPIDESWLKQLGFKKDTEENDFRWFYRYQKIGFDLESFCIRISNSYEFKKTMHVSDMQNLLFELTGQKI
jgi:hypothetical protein